MRFSTTKLGHSLDEVVAKRTPRKIYPQSVKGGRRAAVLVLGKRGRYVRYRIPVRGSCNDIAIMPTIRAAIMHSLHGKIEIKKTDLREKVRRRKISIILVLIVDGSSSMVGRKHLATLRGLLDGIFMDVYQKRDRLAVVHCAGGQAKLLLSLAGNLEAGRGALEKATWGGTDSLPEGIAMAKDIVMHGLQIDKNAIPIVMVVSDGNFLPDAMDELAQGLERLSEKAGVLCVDLGDEEGGASWVDMVMSLNIGYIHAGESVEPPFLPDMDELRSLLTTMSVLLVNPKCGPAVLSGFDPDAVGFATGLLQEKLWDVDTIAGCPAGCAFPSPGHEHDASLCAHCRSVSSANKLQQRTVVMPLVHSHDVDDISLRGRVYVRRLVLPGALSIARNGMLVLSPPAVDDRFDRMYADAFAIGRIHPVRGGAAIHVPAGRKAIVMLPSGIDDTRTIGRADAIGSSAGIVLRRRPDRRFSATNLKMARDAALSPAMTSRELRAQFAPLLDSLKNACDNLRRTRASDDVLVLIARVAKVLGPEDPALQFRALEASRAFAAIGGRTSVDKDDVKKAFSMLVEDFGPGDEILPLLNEEILDSLEPLLSSLFSEKLMLGIRNPPPGFSDALMARLEKVAPKITVIKGCSVGCSMDDVDLCPECAIVRRAGKAQAGDAKAKVVRVGPLDTASGLLSSKYVRYKLIPGKLAHANRGVLVLENLEGIDPVVFDTLAEAVSRGSAALSDGQGSHPVSFSMIMILEKDEILPPLLAPSFQLEIDIMTLIDGDSVASAAIRKCVGQETRPVVVPIGEAPRAQESIMDIAIAIAKERFPGIPGSWFTVLRFARAMARQSGKTSVGEWEVGEAAGLFKPKRPSEEVKGEGP